MSLRLLNLFCLLVIMNFSGLWAQKSIKIQPQDSVLLSGYKLKIAQTINANPDSSLYYIKKIENFSIEKKYSQGIADADYYHAQYFRRIQLPDSAIAMFKKSVSIAEKIKYFKGLAAGYNGLCRTYYLIGEIENSIAACEKGLKYTKKFEDTGNVILADTENALAIAYSRQNKMEEAITHLLKVDSLHKKTPLREDIIAAAYQSLGNIYLQLKEYDSAEDYYLRANAEFEKIPSAGAFYFNTTNVYLGQVYYHKKLLAKADTVLGKTLVFFEGIKDERTVAEINNYLGLINLDQGNLVKAESYFLDAFNFQKENGYSLEASQSALQLGKVNLQNNNPSKAIPFLQEALKLNNEVKNGTVNQEAHAIISKAYAAMGNYAAAYENSQMAANIKDSIQQLQSADKIKELEGIYQTESRDKEISLLTTQNQLAQQQKSNQRNILLAVVIILLIAAIFFFFQYRNRQKTNEKLKELDHAKSTFFTNISHEFRTPLTLINGPIEDQLASPKISTVERKNLNTALRNTNRLKDLVDQLLALSKLESKNLKLKIQQSNLPQFLLAQAEGFAYSSKEKNIKYSVHIEKDEVVDWFDQDVIEKIIYNLIGNALKYTPENGEINVYGTRENSAYNFSIKNSGNSIPPEIQEKIFERFYQSSTRNPGAGVGLALSKELAELHHGSIALFNEAEGLTEFKIEIPTQKSTYRSDQILIEGLPQEPINPQIISVEKNLPIAEDAPVLLIVDDNREIREYITSIFEQTYIIHTAMDGKVGFTHALENIPDVVISDVMMPEEDGFTLTKNLKENSLTSHIPVILLTAKSEITDKLEGMGIGADAYVTKPFNPQLLRANVENLLENRRKLQQRFAQEVILMPKDISVSSADEQFLERLQKVMDSHITDPDFTTETFCQEMGVSRMQLHRKLKALTGQSTTEFLKSQRLKMALTLLREKKINISEVGYLVGFNDPSYFARCFKQEYGVAPSQYTGFNNNI